MPNTFFGPKDLDAIAATKAESIPPEIPMTTLLKPFFNT